jgi:HAD superfamily hydrolase (TIGR01509 family)
VTEADDIRRAAPNAVEAVIFDLDGVLLDSETIWDEVRRALVERAGGAWTAGATRAIMGMSSREWSAYLHDELGVPKSPDAISAEVAAEVERRTRAHLPWLPGARDAVVRLAERWALGLASSANRSVIEAFLDASGLRRHFAATVSSEEVPRGKPAPDVYLAVAEQLQIAPEGCVAIEDSTNGLRAAVAARMAVVAIPNRHFPPEEDALARAAVVVRGPSEITPDVIERARVAT